MDDHGRWGDAGHEDHLIIRRELAFEGVLVTWVADIARLCDFPNRVLLAVSDEPLARSTTS
jgi:hypothetical protein